MLILVTDLTAGCYSSAFLASYGCDEYFAHNKELRNRAGNYNRAADRRKAKDSESR